ncbi:hypothetical protein [Leptolyngbya sp. 7M]|uniref:hypothetical protein n=1 Tax=Leptolyngbya sp. 7M TaxID=2812896 RepID=UPI001B8D7D64|nr:hypothetical protein [Leptolyngbya sp. 7M]QYO67760.1 hypothetical protein JVX88_13805 [Leptolyngbya sp. 7M]
MLSDIVINSVCESVVAETLEDYVGLWSIIWQFREIYKETDPLEIQRGTLQVVETLLKAGLIRVGAFKNGEFEVWNLSSEEILNYIKRVWEEGGKEPNIGDIVWFESIQEREQE